MGDGNYNAIIKLTRHRERLREEDEKKKDTMQCTADALVFVLIRSEETPTGELVGSKANNATINDTRLRPGIPSLLELERALLPP